MATDPTTGRQIRDVARERGGRGVITESFDALVKGQSLKSTLGTSQVSRISRPDASPTRDIASAKDLRQIKNRQEAEALPEGDVRRKSKF